MTKESKAVHWAIGAVSTFIILQGTIYYFYRISAITVAATVAAIAVIFFIAAKPNVKNWRRPKLIIPRPVFDLKFGAGAAVVVFDLILIAIFVSARTTEALASPWQVVPFPAFILFGLATFLLLWLSKNVSGRIMAALLSLHLFVAYGIAETVYAYGFGFDPFIHRATEEHIAKFGFILPKKPFYNGQYVLTVTLHWLTNLSIDAIDRWLVPVTAALTLPWVLRESLAKFWLKPSPNEAFWSIGILLFPMLPLTFTTPSNLTVLFLLYTILLLPQAEESKSARKLLALVAIASIVIHPLIGMLGACLVVSYLICKKTKNLPLAAALALLLNAAIAPCLLIANNIMNSGRPFVFGDFLSRWPMFAGLFTSPYAAFAGPRYNGWDLLYGFYALLPLGLALGAIVGAIVLWREGKQRLVAACAATSLGSILAAGAISMAVYIPDVISFEQSEFSLRLVHAAGLVLMPLFFAGADAAFRKIILKEISLAGAAFFITLALAIVAALYLTYPQYNERVQYAGWGVSRADFDAARLIHGEAGGNRYIVLSDQMLSVAALRLYGFKDLAYAIPTGGELYQYFLRMTEGEESRQTMDDAMAYAGVSRAFFALSDYYPYYGELCAGAAAFSDKSWSIDGGRLTIFEFISKK